ncbi:NAD(P)-dependent oxidoreductase [Nocardioides sp. BP30]|uniref:NAD(P)-dependent oxidoreductase n=1 Tax=Nocardioides sp. BP30 TaxID=3036374 RepID=UPI00246872B6|nr:NAD(P)-dependent oxidoreductase [Nocardioides sp. BP30]WGL52479.1 NAD(P)-dependent oxidoreductase [Nocardioides sp. BP30]
MTGTGNTSAEKVGLIGVGDMGLPMSGHMVRRGLDVVAYDVDPARLAAAVEGGVTAASSVAEVAARTGIVIACLRTDDQMAAVAAEVAEHGRPGQLLVVAGTHSLALMRRLAESLEAVGGRVIDAPVVYGTTGAREGTLLSLCGGATEDVERARPALMGYSRGVEHVGALGAGQIAKACNNLLHWVHSVANFETLALAKRYGVDAQRMREVLLQSPAENGTLRRWDGTRFTWQEKDMDLVTELAQEGGLMLPLTGQVDQLVKSLTAGDVADLLYGEECRYLGRVVSAMSAADGGL